MVQKTTMGPRTTDDIVFFIGFLVVYSVIAAMVWVVCQPFVYIKNKLKRG